MVSRVLILKEPIDGPGVASKRRETAQSRPRVAKSFLLSLPLLSFSPLLPNSPSGSQFSLGLTSARLGVLGRRGRLRKFATSS